MASNKTPPQQQTSSQAARIKQVRGWIAAAEHDGLTASELLLRLTSRDAAALKRNPEVAVHEVTFAAGEMRFLGVKVQEGSVPDSVLERLES